MSAPMGILVDTTRCTGCEDCVKACKEWNNLGPDEPYRWKRRIDDLSSTRYTTIIAKEGGHFIRQFCRHCLDPACASACIVGALHKSPDGPVTYDPDKCMGCRYCMNACPFGIPRYDWERAVPLIRKCHLCHDRLAAGKIPACVEACTYDATLFGEREELLRVAHERIRANPELYHDKVWGESEVGGTSVLYISDIPLDFLAYSSHLDTEALPELTWAALSKVPKIVVGMGALMTGTYWVIGRRMKIAAEAAQGAPPSPAQPQESSRDGEEESR